MIKLNYINNVKITLEICLLKFSNHPITHLR
nr:MAG TPA: hypothetical protein [Caudoviricetes sp.]